MTAGARILRLPTAATRARAAEGRLREALSVLEAIEAGELLSTLPEEAAARPRHETGLALLAILKRELHVAIASLSAQNGPLPQP